MQACARRKEEAGADTTVLLGTERRRKEDGGLRAGARAESGSGLGRWGNRNRPKKERSWVKRKGIQPKRKIQKKKDFRIS